MPETTRFLNSPSTPSMGLMGELEKIVVSSFIYSYTISSSSSATVFNAIEMPMHASSFCMTVNALNFACERVRDR
jgi:hypothetical protein